MKLSNSYHLQQDERERLIRAVFLGLLGMMSLTSIGCTLAKTRLNPNIAFPQQPYEQGVTHRDEVLGELGPPLKMTSLPDGYAFMYEGVDTKELQIGFTLPIPIVNWFKFVVARADYNHHVMVYQFDRDHKLLAAAGDDTHFDLGDSMSVQPVLSVQLLFDTSDVEDDIVHFTEWPAFCLWPLPETINRANSMNTGAAGIEQRGTSPSVGQRSPELRKQ